MSDGSGRVLVVSTWIVVVAVAVAGVVLHARLGPVDTYWTIDNGGKALALAELRAGRTWVTYPARDLDPDFRYFPQPLRGSERYAQLRGGHVVSQYLSPFVAMTVPFDVAFGFGGLTILPAIGAGACVALAAWLARRRTRSPGAGLLAAAITAAASPLMFYAAVFWEHAWVGALATGALVALDDLRHEHTRSAGALLALACLLREEMGLLLMAAVLVLVVRRRWNSAGWVAALGALGVVSLAAFHRWTSGSVWGVHLDVNRPFPFTHTLDAIPGLLLGTGLGGVTWLVPAFALTALYVVGRGRGGTIAIPVVTLLLGALSLAAWIRFPGGEDSALALIRSNSALVFVPWILVASAWIPRPASRPARGVERKALRGADAIALAFVALVLVTVPERSITGVHPGPRILLLPLVPVLAATLAEGIRSAPGRAAALLPLLLLALAWNLRSLDLLHEKRLHAGRLLSAIRARPEPVVATPLFWLPTELSALWSEKTFFFTGTGENARDLTVSLAQNGVSSLLIADRPRQVPAPPVGSVESPLFPEHSVDLWTTPLRLPPPTAPRVVPPPESTGP